METEKNRGKQNSFKRIDICISSYVDWVRIKLWACDRSWLPTSLRLLTFTCLLTGLPTPRCCDGDLLTSDCSSEGVCREEGYYGVRLARARSFSPKLVCESTTILYIYVKGKCGVVTSPFTKGPLSHERRRQSLQTSFFYL